MMLFKILLPLLLLLGFFTSVSFAALSDAGTQFINYTGTISGSFAYRPPAPSNCSPTYYFDSLNDSIVLIGTNPPWDPNPFYFSMDRRGSTSSPPAGSICLSFTGAAPLIQFSTWISQHPRTFALQARVDAGFSSLAAISTIWPFKFLI
jgi:hypothetical protein